MTPLSLSFISLAFASYSSALRSLLSLLTPSLSISLLTAPHFSPLFFLTPPFTPPSPLLLPLSLSLSLSPRTQSITVNSTGTRGRQVHAGLSKHTDIILLLYAHADIFPLFPGHICYEDNINICPRKMTCLLYYFYALPSRPYQLHVEICCNHLLSRFPVGYRCYLLSSIFYHYYLQNVGLLKLIVGTCSLIGLDNVISA